MSPEVEAAQETEGVGEAATAAPDVLYHFTRASAMLSILRDQQIRLTSPRVNRWWRMMPLTWGVVWLTSNPAGPIPWSGTHAGHVVDPAAVAIENAARFTVEVPDDAVRWVESEEYAEMSPEWREFSVAFTGGEDYAAEHYFTYKPIRRSRWTGLTLHGLEVPL
jgi:hypothetical protein